MSKDLAPSASCKPCNTECGCCDEPHMQSDHEPQHECHATAAEDQNGHKIDAFGKLVFDERCRNCDAPKPSAEMQKLPVWDKTIDALRRNLQRGFVRNTFDELIVYLRTLEREHRAMKAAMEYVRDFDPEKDTVTEKTYDEWGEAEAFRMCKAKSSEVLSSITL